MLFSKDEISEIFKPDLIKKVFEEKQEKDKAKEQEHVNSYRNTKT
jgi:hypothetical protein